jgi:hypothetical protein
VVEIVPNGAGLAFLDEGLGGSPAKCRQRLRAIPRHRLFLAAGPVRYPADDLEHFTQPPLRLRSPAALGPVERLPGQSSRFGKLALGHAETVGHLFDGDLSRPVHIGQNQRLILRGYFECLTHEIHFVIFFDIFTVQKIGQIVGIFKFPLRAPNAGLSPAKIRAADAMALQLVVEGLARDAERFDGQPDITLMLGKGLADDCRLIAFHFLGQAGR